MWYKWSHTYHLWPKFFHKHQVINEMLHGLAGRAYHNTASRLKSYIFQIL